MPNRFKSARIAVALALVGATLSEPLVAAPPRQASQIRPEVGTISGVLIDPLGSPAADVTLILDNETEQVNTSGPDQSPVLRDMRTDAAGRYRFERVPAGTYVLSVPVSFVKPTVITVASGQHVERDIQLEFETFTVGLTVCGLCLLPPDGPIYPDSLAADALTAPAGVAPEPISGPELIAPGNREYTDDFLLDQGTVVLQGRIDTDGRAKDLQVISASRLTLARPAVVVVQRERWRPARVRGVAVAVGLKITVDFRHKVE